MHRGHRVGQPRNIGIKFFVKVGIKIRGKEGFDVPFSFLVDTGCFIVRRGLRVREMVEIGVQVFVEIHVKPFWQRHIWITG
jgi:hypothetical protein